MPIFDKFPYSLRSQGDNHEFFLARFIKVSTFVAMAMSKDVKFIVLVFLNISCLFLCGWYGIQNVIRSQELSSASKVDHLKLDANWHMLGGGSASIALALLTFLNLLFIVVSKIVCGNNVDKNYVVMQSLSHVATFCIVLMGSIVVVMLGKISAVVDKSEDGDIVFVSVVIAFVLLLMLLQVSTIDVSLRCCTDVKSGPEDVHSVQDELGDEEFLVFSSGQKIRGNQIRVEETSFITNRPHSSADHGSCKNDKSTRFTPKVAANTSRRFPTIPGIEITSSDLHSAKRKLRKSTISSQGLDSKSSDGDFGIYRPPQLMPILVEDLISESRSNLEFDLAGEDQRTRSTPPCPDPDVTHVKSFDSVKDLLEDDVFEQGVTDFKGSRNKGSNLKTKSRSYGIWKRGSLPTTRSPITPRPRSAFSIGAEASPFAVHGLTSHVAINESKATRCDEFPTIHLSTGSAIMSEVKVSNFEDRLRSLDSDVWLPTPSPLECTPSVATLKIPSTDC